MVFLYESNDSGYISQCLRGHVSFAELGVCLLAHQFTQSHRSAHNSSSAMKSCAVLAVLLVVVATFAHADVIRCYKCSTVTNKNCGDPFNSTYVPKGECEGASTHPRDIAVCKKVKQRVNNGELQTIRSCVWIKPEDTACPPSPPSAYIKEESCSQCNADLCNGVATHSIWAPLVLTGALLYAAL